jgi:cell wall assembly regulator SMI1
MKDLESILKRLELFLAGIGAPVLNILRPGIDKSHVNRLINEVDLSFKEDVYELYAWRNGTKDANEKLIGEMTLFTNGILHSLDEAIDIYRYNALDNSQWDKDYFPLFSSGGGDFLLLDIGETL